MASTALMRKALAVLAVGHTAVALQGRQGKELNLPTALEVLSKPAEAWYSMNSSMEMLGARLADQQARGEEQEHEIKEEYAQKKEQQLSDYRATRGDNMRIAGQIRDLEAANARLRKEGNALIDQSRVVRADIASMMVNVSTAVDFAHLSLDRSDGLLNMSHPDLKVLMELANKDTARMRVEDQEQSMQELVAPAAMLQLGAAFTPQEVLKSLIVSLGNVTEEQEASEAHLKAVMEQEVQEGTTIHFRLVQERDQLRQKLADVTTTHERLLTGVNHVRELHERLLGQSDSLRVFLRWTGEHMDRPGSPTAAPEDVSKDVKDVMNPKASSKVALASMLTKLLFSLRRH